MLFFLSARARLQRRPLGHFAARKMLGEVAKELGQGVVIIEG
jgi:hypothetical protein